jgi:hypothetical protein
MKLSLLIFSVLLIACCPSFAAQDERFVEFSAPSGKTRIYDLTTVQMMHPGRLTIISTAIDKADVMKLELKVLETLRAYRNRPDGRYPPPTDLFTLGRPDIPTAIIEVKSSRNELAGKSYSYKEVSWSYPI